MNVGERAVVRRRKRVSDERMLDAACVEFAREGYHAANVARIAEAAETTKATIYARFGSKAGLFGAALGREGDSLRRRLLAAYDATDVLARERLHLYVHAYFSFGLERPDGFKLLFVSDVPAAVREDVDRFAEISERIAELIARENGEDRPSEADQLVAALIVGATHHGAGAMAAHGVAIADAAAITEAFLRSALRFRRPAAAGS